MWNGDKRRLASGGTPELFLTVLDSLSTFCQLYGKSGPKVQQLPYAPRQDNQYCASNYIILMETALEGFWQSVWSDKKRESS
jgi:hypothetical protein